MMDLHLAAISADVAPGRHAALLVDQAGWHLSAKLAVPDNITLVKQRSGLALRRRVRWLGIGEGWNHPRSAECDPQGRLNRHRNRFRQLQHGRNSDISALGGDMDGR